MGFEPMLAPSRDSGPYYKRKLELKSNSSEVLPVNRMFCVHIFLFALKVRLKNFKYEFCQFTLE